MSPSGLCVQTPREPADFAKSTGFESDIPHDKLTIAQARRGTPGCTYHHLFKKNSEYTGKIIRKRKVNPRCFAVL